MLFLQSGIIEEINPVGAMRFPFMDHLKRRFPARISWQTWFVLGFFLAFLVMGLILYPDYGLHWDSVTQMDTGKVNYEYIFKGSKTLLNYRTRYYGPVFEIILYAITQSMPLRQMFFTRNLLIFLDFYVGVFFFYLLARKLTRRWELGLLVAFFLIASPRIFADGFYNARDIPLLTAFIIAVYTLMLYLEQKTYRHAILHALASAFLVAHRIPGFLIPALTISLLGIHILFRSSPVTRTRWLWSGLLYTALTAGLIYLFWPILWHDPLGELINAFGEARAYPWRGGIVFYRGQFLDAKQLPWHYVPVWVLVTTPFLYIISATIGFGKGALQLFLKPGKILDPQKQNFIILTAWLVLPWLAVALTHATLYDAWRHLFFIYPPILLFAIQGIQAVFSLRLPRVNPRLFQGILAALIILGILDPTLFMVRYHPFENVYFNRLAGEDMQEIKRKYELDYWGLSYRKGLEYILANDPSAPIPIYVENQPGEINEILLPEAQQKRLHYVSNPQKAKYYLTNYRWHPQPYDYPDEVFSIVVGDASIFSVFQLKP